MVGLTFRKTGDVKPRFECCTMSTLLNNKKSKKKNAPFPNGEHYFGKISLASSKAPEVRSHFVGDDLIMLY